MLRTGKNEDLPFIYSTWLRNLYYSNEMFNKIEKRTYYAAYSKIMENIIALPQIVVTICCLDDAPDVIVGYIITRGPVLHYAYVKNAWRRASVFNKLVSSLEEPIKSVSHITKAGDAIRIKRGWDYNPFAL